MAEYRPANDISLLQIAFVVLRLCGVIDWSWWWVLAPMWMAVGVAAISIPIVLLVKRGRKKKINSLLDKLKNVLGKREEETDV